MKLQIVVPVYRVYVNIYMFSKQKELNKINNKILSNFGEEEDSVSCTGRSYAIYINKDGYRSADIVIDKSTISHGLIAHEVLHSVNHILRYVDIPLTEESEEAYTTLNHYLIESIYSRFKELEFTFE